MLAGSLLALTLSIAAPTQVSGEAAPLLTSRLRIHDPFVVADAETRTYWLFTHNDPAVTGDRRLGIMTYTSRDLARWSAPRIVFTLPEGTWAREGAWAPEVHRWRGRWYLFATFHNTAAPIPARVGTRAGYRRATLLATAERLGGPFTLVRGGEPVAPADRMTLDGTLYIDPADRPWMVYAREWLQVGDGAMEAVPLTEELRAAGAPQTLFRASAAPWVAAQPQPDGTRAYVTDGPQLFRTRTGTLLMLWSSYGADGYVQALARSRSGDLAGPWEQLGPLVERDSGHGMVFRAFDGRLMLVLHRPFKRALAKLYEVRDVGDRIEIVREAVELDGEAYPTHGRPAGAR